MASLLGLVVVGLLSLCVVAVDNTVERSTCAHAAKFRKIFGADQFDAHFQTSADFMTAVQGKQNLFQQRISMSRDALKGSDALSDSIKTGGEEDVVSNFVLCTSHVGGESMRQALNKQLGADRVHPVYQSASDNSFCFLLALSSFSPSSSLGIDQSLVMNLAMSAGASLEFVLPQPDVIKIHHSVLDHFMLLNHQTKADAVSTTEDMSSHDTNATKKTQRKKQYREKLVANSKLSVSLGLGNGHHTVIGDAVRKQLHSDLLSKHPHEHIQYLLRHTLVADVPTQFTATTTSTDGSIATDNIGLSAGASAGGLWQRAIEELSGTTTTKTSNDDGDVKSTGLSAQEEDVCHFSKLTFANSSSSSITSLSISGLGHITTHAAAPMSCLASLLAFLASHSVHITDVRYTLPDTVLNKYGKSVVQRMTSDQQTPYSVAGLTGAGQVVGMGDSGLDEKSCYFSNSDGPIVARSPFYAPTYDLSKRKVIQYINFADGKDTSGGHGTHVGGTIAGASLGDFTVANGHAEGAKIAFFDMSTDGNSIVYPEPIDKTVFQPAFNAGAKLHSNSWGSPLNIYQQSVLNVDAYHLEQDQFLALFAAGNDGAEGYYSIGTPAVSKNALTVGASKAGSSSGNYFYGPIDQVAYFSSLGPSFDKRIKPDVVAPGSFIESAKASGSDTSSCALEIMQGTSMATPAVAGVAAQVRQYFEDPQFWATTCKQSTLYPRCTSGAFAPRGATVKAVLIHSGEAMGSYYGGSEPYASLGSPPDYYQGFGLVFLQNVLPYVGIETVLDLFVEEVTLSSWQTLRYEVVVADVTRPLKVTVVWMDPVNSVVSDKLLLHDIDVTLQLIGDSDLIHGNNIINDEFNNVEQASIRTPVVGTYAITITSKTFSENNGVQKASVIITSGGEVTARSLESLTATSASYCSATDQLMTMNLLDRGGDGWPADTSYEIRDESNIVYKTGSLGSSPSQDFNVPVTFCLPTSVVYTIHLQLPDESVADALDIGLEIPQCMVYLSYYHTNATLDLSSDPLSCNPCGSNAAAVSMYFADSPLLNHYGWNRGSTYSLTTVPDEDYEDFDSEMLLLRGTLLYGYVGWVNQCLPAGSYRLVFESAESSDDDEYSGNYLYQAALTGCVKTGVDDDVPSILDDDAFYVYPEILEAYQMKITVSESGSCTVDISLKSDNSPPDHSSGAVGTQVTLFTLHSAVAITLALSAALVVL